MNSDAGSPRGGRKNQPEAGTTDADCSAVADAQTPESTPRRHQIFPVLTDAEIDRKSRFGVVHSYATGDFLYRVGGVSPGMFVLLSGTIRYTARDGLGHPRLLRSQAKRGEFTSDIGMLSGKSGLFDAEVIEDVEALVIAPEKLRALMIGEAELGERIMRALILRRVAAIERGQGVMLAGPPDNGRLLALQHFLQRNAYPHMTLDESGADAIALLERMTPRRDQ
jgi:thioredoxin reductase (NADPH)